MLNLFQHPIIKVYIIPLVSENLIAELKSVSRKLRLERTERGGQCSGEGLLIVHREGLCSLWGTSIKPVSSVRCA